MYRKAECQGLCKGIAFILLFACFGSFLIIASTIDFSGPILTEINPNGTVDTWYLFDRAYVSLG